MTPFRIAIIGSGISGLTAAYRLSDRHEVTVYEANACIGGHTHTVEVTSSAAPLFVDTGFIVYNRVNYPRFDKLLHELRVATQPSEMSFSVRCDETGFEYAGNSLNSLFAQRSNLVNPAFYGMLRDILRFNRRVPKLLTQPDDGETLGHYLAREGYGSEFRHYYIIPMGAAIWSAEEAAVDRMPVRYFVRFFFNHGLLTLTHRPQWRVITGGSCQYLPALTAPYRDRIRTSSPVTAIRRFDSHVEVTSGGETQSYDRVVLAAHSDQALRMLADPSSIEQQVLGSIPYQANDVVLHTDSSLLPVHRTAWSSWNYHVQSDHSQPAAVTYLMNRLQNLSDSTQYLVTLNRTERINPAAIIRRMTYHHPVYSPQAVAAQKRHAEISGQRRTHYCGAYWGYGFHEDGVVSAENVVREIEAAAELTA